MLNISMLRSITISSESSVKIALFSTTSKSWVYPCVKNRMALAYRFGVFNKPSRDGSSPNSCNSTRTASSALPPSLADSSEKNRGENVCLNPALLSPAPLAQALQAHSIFRNSPRWVQLLPIDRDEANIFSPAPEKDDLLDSTLNSNAAR